jgi:hypothetical protein
MLTPRQMAKTRRTPDGHLLWEGGFANGYPAIKVEGKTVYVKRLLWEETNEAIPEGVVVVSTCGERTCVEPSHLGLTGPGRHAGPKSADGRYASAGHTDDLA